MQAKSGESCVERNLQLTDYFWGKIVQIYDMMVVRCVCGVLNGAFDSYLTHDAGGSFLS